MYTQFHTQCEIISEFYFYYADESFGNDEIIKWHTSNFTAVSLAHAYGSLIEPDSLNDNAYVAIDKAFQGILDIFGITEPTDRPIGQRGFQNWGEFLDTIEKANNGRFQRHDEVWA